MNNLILLPVYCILILVALIGPFVLNSYLKSKRKADRENIIRARQQSWGEEICQALIDGEVTIGMTQDMVSLAWGKPWNIDRKTTTQKYYQERWVYGVPKRGSGANYITFRNGEVIETIINNPIRVNNKGGFNAFIVSLGLLIGVGCTIGVLESSLSQKSVESTPILTRQSQALPSPTRHITQLTFTPIPTPKSQIEITPKIVIKDYDINVDNVEVDKLYLDKMSVLLRNDGDAPVEIDKIVLSSGTSRIENTLIGSLNSGEEKISSLPTYPPLERDIGSDQIKALIRVTDSLEKILVEKDIAIPIPVARVGDIIPEIDTGSDKHNLSLALLSWKEGNIVVDGPYVDGYYTFTAKPGMKFVILIFKFQNNWTREQEIPYLNAGEIATDKGYIYTVWKPPVGAHSEEYKPRKATNEEIETLMGDSGGYEQLLPEESIEGHVVFEIPKDETPIEASIVSVSPIIRFGED